MPPDPHPTAPEAREAIARAIYKARNGTGCVPWSRLTGTPKAAYRDDADAALTTLPLPARLRAIGVDPETRAVVPRVATQEMQVAGLEEVQHALDRWRDMTRADDLRTMADAHAAMLAAADAEGAR